MDWFLQVLKKYAVFNGRAQRMEYWMFTLISTIIYIALTVGLGFISASLAGIVALVYQLAVLVPSIAVGIRRMHDIGRSGWWILFPVVNLIFLCLDSQADENEYGPNPKKA